MRNSNNQTLVFEVSTVIIYTFYLPGLIIRYVPGILRSTTVDPRRDSLESLKVPPLTTRFNCGHSLSNSYTITKEQKSKFQMSSLMYFLQYIAHSCHVS